MTIVPTTRSDCNAVGHVRLDVWVQTAQQRHTAQAEPRSSKQERKRLLHIVGSLQRELTLTLEREAKSEVCNDWGCTAPAPSCQVSLPLLWAAARGQAPGSRFLFGKLIQRLSSLTN